MPPIRSIGGILIPGALATPHTPTPSRAPRPRPASSVIPLPESAVRNVASWSLGLAAILAALVGCNALQRQQRTVLGHVRF